MTAPRSEPSILLSPPTVRAFFVVEAGGGQQAGPGGDHFVNSLVMCSKHVEAYSVGELRA